MTFDAARSTTVSTLVASWAALVRGSGGSIESGPAFVAARCTHAVFNNALLLEPDADAVAAVRRVYGDTDVRWSLWTGDAATAEVASASGCAPDGGTTDMTRTLTDLPAVSADATVVASTPATVAALNGLSGGELRGVTGFDAFTAGDGSVGLMTFRHEQDVHLSFLATRPEHRRRGLASALVVAALHEARRRGAETASLQATHAAVGLYERLGFRVVGGWREWRLA